jgi:hypothetical protein
MAILKQFILVHELARNSAIEFLRNAPLESWAVNIIEKVRTLDQNAKFHAMCEDIGKQGLIFAGRPRDAAAWKVLFISGHAIATGEGAEVVAGLESEFVNLRESSAQMSQKRASSLIEYVIAYCTKRQIKLKEPSEYARYK